MKKGVILVVVMGVFIVLATLAIVVVSVMSQEARVAEHKMKRMRAFYAAKAGVVHAFARLKAGHTHGAIETADLDLDTDGDGTDDTHVDITIDPVISGGPYDGTYPVHTSVTY